MTMQYLGLVVGGPADGNRIVYATKTLVVEEKPSTNLIELSATPVPFVPTQHKYHWTDCGPLALWLLEGWDIPRAMAHMAETIGIEAVVDRYEQILLRRKDDARHG